MDQYIPAGQSCCRKDRDSVAEEIEFVEEGE
jgi:hypothetical protein